MCEVRKNEVENVRDRKVRKCARQKGKTSRYINGGFPHIPLSSEAKTASTDRAQKPHHDSVITHLHQIDDQNQNQGIESYSIVQ